MSALSSLRLRIEKKVPGGTTSEFLTDSLMNEGLNRSREFMYTKFDWPHLRVEDIITFTNQSGTLPSDFLRYESLKSTNGQINYLKVSPDKFDTLGGSVWTIKTMCAASRTIAASPGGLVRSSNVITVTTTTNHPYEVGDSVTLASTTAVGATTFDGTYSVVSVPSATTFTVADTDSNDTGGAGTVSRTDGQRRIYMKNASVGSAIMRYFRSLTDMSADADDSGFPSHLEEAMVYGALKFIAEADRDGNWIQNWEKEFMDYLKPIHTNEVLQDRGYEHPEVQSVYESKSLLFSE